MLKLFRDRAIVSPQLFPVWTQTVRWISLIKGVNIKHHDIFRWPFDQYYIPVQ